MGDLLSSLVGGGGGDYSSYTPNFQHYNPLENLRDLPLLPDVKRAWDDLIQPLSCQGANLSGASKPLPIVPPQTEAEDKTLTETLFEIGLSVAIGLITSSSATRMVKAVVADGATASQIASGFFTIGRRTAEITVGIPAGSAAFFSGVMSLLQGTGLGVLGGLADSAVGQESGFWENMVDYSYLGFTASLGPIMGSLWGMLRAERIAVEVVEKASLGKNLFDGFFSGGVSDAAESVRDQWKEKRDISWGEVALSGATGAGVGSAFGCVMPFLFDGAGWAAKKVFKPAPPSLPSPLRVRREAREVLNGLHTLAHNATNPGAIKERSRAIMAQYSHLTEEALESAGLNRGLLSEVGTAIDEAKDLAALRGSVTRLRLQAAKDEMGSYVPDPRRRRLLPGGIHSNQAEGIREIPEALRDDPTFIDLHPNGDFNAQLPPKNRFQVIEYLLGIKLTHEGNPIENLNGLDDGDLKKLLRYIGVHCDSEQEWTEELRLARDGWERVKSDMDDVLEEQLRVSGFDTSTPILLLKLFGAPLQLIPGANGGINVIAQSHPLTPLLLSALKRGPVPIETDSFPQLLRCVVELFPPLRRVVLGLEPYQIPTLKHFLESGTCKTAVQHLEAIRGLLAHVKEVGFDRLTLEFKNTVAIIVRNARGWKLKLQTLYAFLPRFKEVFSRLKDMISIDNALYYAEFIFRLGGKAIRVLDRSMSLLRGNWVTADSWGHINSLVRNTRLRGFAFFVPFLEWMGRVTSRNGINKLPSTQYGSDDITKAIRQMEKQEGPCFTNLGIPEPKGRFRRLMNFLYHESPNQPMKTKNVYRGHVHVTLFSFVRDYLWAAVIKTHIAVFQLKKVLKADVDTQGVSAHEKADKLYNELISTPLQDMPGAKIGLD